VRARVVILNGPPAVGKTTVGRALASIGRNAACVHGDALRDFIVRRNDTEVDLGLGYQNGGTVVANFIAAGYDLVVFEYVVEHPRHLARFIGSCHADADVFLFTLWDTEHALLQRDAARQGRVPVGARVLESRRAIEPHLEQLGHVLDVGARTAAEVAAVIDEATREGLGRLASA
jgi:hypothetical protein